MGLFDPVNTTTELQELEARIVQNNITGMQTLINVISSNWTLIWENPDFTPQEVFNQFGTDAGAFFTIAIAAITFIETVSPGSLNVKYMSAPQPYTINADGTVTVG
jgi:hypothetical protein